MDGQAKPVGPVRGRFGVTRDADGSFATIYAWPWYWRYPLALCAGVALAAFVLSLMDGRERIAAWFIGGVGGLFILSVMYELLATLVVAGIGWWLYRLVSESDGSWHSTVVMVAGSFVVVGVFHLLRRADDTQKALSEANARLVAMERRLERIEARQCRGNNAQLGDDVDDEV
jgi:hypothetical protein